MKFNLFEIGLTFKYKWVSICSLEKNNKERSLFHIGKFDDGSIVIDILFRRVK